MAATPWWWNSPKIALRTDKWQSMYSWDDGEVNIPEAVHLWRESLLEGVDEWWWDVDNFLPVALDALYEHRDTDDRDSDLADEALAFMLSVREDTDQIEFADHGVVDDITNTLRAQIENASRGQIIGYGDFTESGKKFFDKMQRLRDNPKIFTVFFDHASTERP